MGRHKKGSYQNIIKNDENAKVAMKESEQGWATPTKHASIAHFYKKCNKSQKNMNRKINDGLNEDVDIENVEYEEELVEQRKERRKIDFHMNQIIKYILKDTTKRK